MKLIEAQIKFEAYLLTEKRVSQNTFLAYKRDIEQFFLFVRHECDDIKKITEGSIKGFIHSLYQAQLNARSVGRKISALKLLFFWLEREFNIINYGRQLYLPKTEKKLPQYLTSAEIVKLFKIVEADTTFIGLRNKVMLYILYTAGIRVSEFVNLKVCDVRFDTGFLAITGKGGRQRMVPVPQQLLALLRTYLESKKNMLEQKRVPNTSEYLFTIIYAEKIKPISRQSCWIIIKKMCKDAGIVKKISPHSLRHSLATHMLEKGMDLRSLQMMLGHEHIATVQIYTHLEKSHLRAVYDKKHPRS